MTKQRISQREQVAIAVRHMPGCVLQDICDALDMTSSSAGNILRALNNQGIVDRQHNGTQYKYTVAADAQIPDVELPFMQQKAPDPERLQAAEAEAKKLESRGLWRRAATQYISALGLAGNANEVHRISQQRDLCLRNARRA